MSERTLKVLAIAVVGLGLLWLVVSVLPGGGGSAAPSGAIASFFDGVTPESVSELTFRNPEGDEEIRMLREAGEWTVNGYRADSATVRRQTKWDNFRPGLLMSG
jgi:hypothetical protein